MLERLTVKVGLISLGCAKNQVDSECMNADLERAGFKLTSDLAEAEAIVVNTCGFIRPAKEESIETILRAAELRQSGRLRVLAVVGCLSQRYRGELERELPEVDIFLGVGADQRGLPELLREALGLDCPLACRDTLPPRRVETVARGWAYLKVSEGCNNRCAYCAIPLIRGGLASRSPDDLLSEARLLESLGARELNLIAQDVSAWGADTGARVEALLERLLDGTEVPWFRLLYLHPAHLNRSLLEFMARRPRVLPYIDIPIQHASDRVLAAMGRGVTKARLTEIISAARELLDEPVLRTTVMVGFPGERKRDFEELLEFIAEAKFDRLGGFIYSAEEGTHAAGLRDTVPRAEKERRLEAVLDLQRGISAERQESRVDKVLQVLVEQSLDPEERPSSEYGWAGRSRAHAPEVDGWVYLAAERLDPGTFVSARVTDSGDYDLFAEPSD